MRRRFLPSCPAMIQPLEGRRLLSAAPGFALADLLGTAYQGTVQLHVTHGRHPARAALRISFNPTVNPAGLLTGTLNLPNEPALNFALTLRHHALRGSLVGSTGAIRGQFSIDGDTLNGSFWDAVDGQRLIGQFHTSNPALAPRKPGTPGGKAVAPASSNSPAAIPLSVGFSQTAIGSTPGGANGAGGNAISTTTPTSTNSSTGTSSTGAGSSTVAGGSNLNGANTIDLPALGLSIGNLRGNTDLASGVNGSTRAGAGLTAAQQNANAFVANGASNTSSPSAAGGTTAAGAAGPAGFNGGVNASTVQGASGVSGIFTTIDTFTGLPAVTVAPMTFVTD
ncbi:MAG TPA: hypothetical protein VFC78_05735 [Tepidisphaeraceae bacterium]|nr:hypothetical protein [Tepidisphaeraceae bacterium]